MSFHFHPQKYCAGMAAMILALLFLHFELSLFWTVAHVYSPEKILTMFEKMLED